MDYDLLVIGSGPAGYICAIHAAKQGLKVGCIEKRKELGGTCLNVGCIPSKALLQSTELYSKIKHLAPLHGITAPNPTFDFSKMITRKEKILADFNQGIQYLFKQHKITQIHGEANFIDPNTLSVGDQKLTAKNFVIATGSAPISLPFLPLDEKRVLSSTGALSLTSVPKKLAIIGAGVIGVELGSVYARLGTEVVFFEFLDHICPTFDSAISKELLTVLAKQEMQFNLSSQVTDATITPNDVTISTKDQSYTADHVLVAIGRRPSADLNLQAAQITTDDKGFIPINSTFQTTQPHIYAIGDTVDGPMLAHKGSEEGIAVAEIIAGKNPTVDYICIPNVIYTDPEVAAVGLTTEQAKAQNIPHITSTFPFKVNSRARCAEENEGFVKIIAAKENKRLLGIHIIGAHASELIAAGVLAIQQRLTTEELAHTPFAHPTLSEALKDAVI